MTKNKTLADAFLDGLKDALSAERQSVRALKKASKAAQQQELKQALEQHADESQHQIERLTEVFEALDRSPRGKTCEAMQGLLAELDDHLDEFGGTEAIDAVIIGSAQALEHYEIARYGTLKTWAGQLGMNDVAKLLDETLQEEKKTDALLSKLAEQQVNQQAAE